MTPEPYLIGNLSPTDLNPEQINGRACVYCRGTDTLDYAGWLRSPLSPGRHLSAPVVACSNCRGTPALKTRAKEPDDERTHHLDL